MLKFCVKLFVLINDEGLMARTILSLTYASVSFILEYDTIM